MMELTGERITMLRRRFAEDLEFAGQLSRLAAELDGFKARKSWAGPSLPQVPENDPGVLVALVEGCDEATGRHVLVAFLEDMEDRLFLTSTYVARLWEPYHPVTDEDFENLPTIYEILFEGGENQYPDVPVFHVRPYLMKQEDGKWVTDHEVEANDGVYINLVNLNAEGSAILQMIESCRQP